MNPRAGALTAGRERRRLTLFQALVGCAIGCAAIVTSPGVAAADTANSGIHVYYVSPSPYICGEGVAWVDTDPAGYPYNYIRIASTTIRMKDTLCGTAFPDVAGQLQARVSLLAVGVGFCSTTGWNSNTTTTNSYNLDIVVYAQAACLGNYSSYYSYAEHQIFAYGYNRSGSEYSPTALNH